MTKPLPGYDYERALVRNNESGSNTHRKPVYADIAKEIADKYEVTNTKNVVQHLRSVHEQYLIDQKSTERLPVKERQRYFDWLASPLLCHLGKPGGEKDDGNEQ